MILQRLRVGWQLTKAALKVLKEDKEIVLYPVCAALGIIFLIGIFFFISVSSGLIISLANLSIANSARYVFIILFLLAAYIVSIFFEGAIISATFQRCEGRNPTFSSGLSLPAKRTVHLVLWAIILTIVAVFIHIIRSFGKGKSQSVKATSNIGASTLETGWNLLSFFVIPLIIIENLSVFKAFPRSKELFVKTWGENLTAQFTTGALFFILALLGTIPLVIALFVKNSIFLAIAGIGLLLWIIILIILNTTINGILVALLYAYATGRKIPKKYGIASQTIIEKR